MTVSRLDLALGNAAMVDDSFHDCDCSLGRSPEIPVGDLDGECDYGCGSEMSLGIPVCDLDTPCRFACTMWI